MENDAYDLEIDDKYRVCVIPTGEGVEVILQRWNNWVGWTDYIKTFNESINTNIIVTQPNLFERYILKRTFEDKIKRTIDYYIAKINNRNKRRQEYEIKYKKNAEIVTKLKNNDE